MQNSILPYDTALTINHTKQQQKNSVKYDRLKKSPQINGLKIKHP